MKKSIRLVLVMMVLVCFTILGSCNRADDVKVDTGTTETTMEEQTTTIAEEEGLTKISTTAKLIFNDGRFEGWGTGIAWWGNRLGYSDTLTEQAIKLFFDEETGLGMNIVRYNIPGGDDPTHTHIKRTDTKLQGFTYYDEKNGTYGFDMTVNANQRNVLFRIREFCGDKLIAEAYSCSPPYYMTESGCTSGSDKGVTDNLKEEYYDDYAAYIAEVLSFYKEEYGVTFDSISAASEPASNALIGMRTQHEGCNFVAYKSLLSFYSELVTALNEKGLLDNTDISVDIRRSGDGRALSADLMDSISRVNVHMDSNLAEPYSKNVDFINSYGRYAKKNVWISESDSNLKHDKCEGEMSAALWFANKIISDMGGLMPAAWMIENAIDYHISDEGYQGNQDTGMPDTTKGYWGIAVADHDNEKIILTKKYYAYGQFSRYIRPGYTIFADNNDDVLVTYSPDEKKLVIVAVNNAETETELKVSLEAFDYAGGSAKVIRTSGGLEDGENWAELPDAEVGRDVFRVGLKGYSITTFIIDSVDIKN